VHLLSVIPARSYEIVPLNSVRLRLHLLDLGGVVFLLLEVLLLAGPLEVLPLDGPYRLRHLLFALLVVETYLVSCMLRDLLLA
jgi:hypothetical protein